MKLTKEQALELHMQMWSDMLKALGDNPFPNERFSFKRKWIEEHFPNEDVDSDCFLCEYARHVTKDPFIIRCYNCPIAWNSSIRPDCKPGAWLVASSAIAVDFRYSPISVILALPVREDA